jgi:integrase
MRRFGLGVFPQMGISQAREAARTTRANVKEGADPIADKRRDRAIGSAAKEGTGTLASLLDLYGRQRGEELRRWDEAKRRIEVVFKPFLGKPLVDLDPHAINMRADEYQSKQAAAAAVRYLRPILKWGAKRGYVSPTVADLHPPATVKRRDRVLSPDELADLLPVLRASIRPHAKAHHFMLLTLTRREEAGQARWGDVNWQAGTLTLPVTKNGQRHVVPLPRQATELLQSMLPANGAGGRVAPELDALIFATSAGTRLGNWDRETKAIQEASGTSGWTRHDLRRTGATMLGEMGELPDIVEAALNHVSIRSPLAATYNRSRYRPQVAMALQRLADALDGIEAGAGEVVASAI